MTRWLQSSLLVALTFAITWMLATREPANAAPPAVPSKPARMVVEAPPPIPAILRSEPRAGAYTLRRNLFAYVARPPVRAERTAFVAAPDPRRIETPAVQAEPRAPEPPRFPYRFIGRFGPDGNPVAAFAREGEIVTARRGDRIGAFTLREVGLESVEVAGDAGVTRIALGQ